MDDEWQKQDSGFFWKPEKVGDSLEGEFLEQVDGKFGTNCKVRQKDGQIAITGSWKALVSRMSNIENGDMIRIVYKGEEVSKVKGRQPTKLFDVFIKKN